MIMTDTKQCLFCRIGRGEIPATIVAETADCLAFRDITPQAPVHVLVIPRTHVRSLNEAAGTPLVGAIIELATQVAQREGLATSGYRVVFNTNEDGGQTVYHLHAHVLGGRRMHWPPG
jgi:histidine triad (HIT) family protein